ncbi:MAG: TadE/TadG family type IV pilus assembly protein, partial [Candidatus Dormibacteraceae bacterium]
MKNGQQRCVEVGSTAAVTTPSITGLLQAWWPAQGGSAGDHTRPHARQRSQALIEFALVSPVLLVLLFGIVDIGRAVFYYDTVNHAAREGARTAVRASDQLPTNADVLAAVTTQLIGAPVTAPCPQGPVTSATPPANAAWLYITEPAPPATVEANPPPNAPGGEYPASSTGSCSAVNPAGGAQQLQVTLRF